MKTTTPEALGERLRAGQSITLIDVRTPVEYRAAHVAGACSVPLDRFDADAFVRDRQPASGPLYVICQSGARGRKACEALTAAGHDEAVNVEGGTDACEMAGLPIVRGKAVITLERQVRMAAGAIVLIGTLLGAFVHPLMLIIPAFVGAGLLFAGVTDSCAMGMILSRMPWNRANGSSPERGTDTTSCAAS